MKDMKGVYRRSYAAPFLLLSNFDSFHVYDFSSVVELIGGNQAIFVLLTEINIVLSLNILNK